MNPLKLLLVLSLLLSSLLAGCSSDDSQSDAAVMQLQTIEGEVEFAARGGIPLGSNLHVDLIDVTESADDPIVLASSHTGSEVESPYEFSLIYDPSIILEGRVYRVRAQIRRSDKIVDDSADRLDPFSGQALQFSFVPPPPPPRNLSLGTISLQGPTWYLAELGGSAVDTVAEARPYLEVGRDSDSYSGFAGCNRYSGSYELNGTSLALSPAAATRMACPDTMEIESQFLEMLGRVGSWRLEGQQIALGDAERNVLARFSLTVE